MDDSIYKENLIKRLINKEIDTKDLKNLEDEFIKSIEKLGFRLERSDGPYHKFFKFNFGDGIYLLLTTDMAYDEEYNYTSWGHWQISNEDGGILFYISSDVKPNISTWYEGKSVDGTACFGFWKEGINEIKPFLENYMNLTEK